MHIAKAVITAAGRNQRTLPLQTLIDRDGEEKSVLAILLDEVHRAGIEEVGLVVRPGDEEPYAAIVGHQAAHVHFVQQAEPMGHGHAVYCARDFVGADPFLHLVGDHLYVSNEQRSCAQQLVTIAANEHCSISTVQATRETLLPYYGAIGGRRIQGQPSMYAVETVIEKPTPTIAEQRLVVSGLRAGHYLCFFGMHVLTNTVMAILGELIAAAHARGGRINVTLAEALARLPQRERYLAVEQQYSRYDVGVKYGLLNAQLALALNGADREQVLTMLLELLAQRELTAKAG